LEALDLSYNHIADQIMVPLADVLANNQKVKALIIGCAGMFFRPLVTSNDSGAAFSHIMCNPSSILRTYNSDHTVGKLCHEIFDSALPANIMSLLESTERAVKAKLHAPGLSILISVEPA
jgi:hypothetical protein